VFSAGAELMGNSLGTEPVRRREDGREKNVLRKALQWAGGGSWLIIGAWFLLGLATVNYNGPFFDEGIYITAGQRTLEGHGYSDGYLVWFAGSLFWPILAAVGYKVGGLIGTRIVALILATIAFVAAVQAARNLFGQQAGFWTAAVLATSGPFMALARLGVYDLPALAGIAVSFWAVTELVRKDNRIWLVLAAVAFTAGFFSKYPMGIMLLPIAGVIFVLRREKAVIDVALFGFISSAIALAFYLPGREQLSQFLAWTAENKPTFDVTPLMVVFDIIYFSGALFLLGLSGWVIARDKRALASVLLSSLAIWPAYHLLSGNPVGAPKHLVFGFLFACPLAGLALATLWESWKRKAVVLTTILALAALGYIQVAEEFNRAWPDAREAANYLVSQVQPGQKLLINESWPYTMYLYTTGRIDSPWDVFDVYRLTHNQSTIDLCQYDWFVDSKGSYEWPESILEEIKQCADFQLAFSTTSVMVGLGSDLDFVVYPVHVTIWRNSSRKAGG
jgi:4-amino-4-deoxy-L-arabinose transferase-like glycosyltransferase